MASQQAEDESSRDERALISYATSAGDDFYDILNLPSPLSDEATSEADFKSKLNKAWRHAALRLHPDKNQGNEKEAAIKYDQARKAFNVLSNAAAKAAYDGKLAAQKAKQEREGLFEGRRKALRDDLLRREREAAEQKQKQTGRTAGSSGSGADGLDDKRREKEQLEQQLRAEGARRVAERNEQIQREWREEQEKARQKENEETDARIEYLEARLEKLGAKKRKRMEKGKDGDSSETLEPSEGKGMHIPSSMSIPTAETTAAAATATAKASFEVPDGEQASRMEVDEEDEKPRAVSALEDRMRQLLQRCREADVAAGKSSKQATESSSDYATKEGFSSPPRYYSFPDWRNASNAHLFQRLLKTSPAWKKQVESGYKLSDSFGDWSKPRDYPTPTADSSDYQLSDSFRNILGNDDMPKPTGDPSEYKLSDSFGDPYAYKLSDSFGNSSKPTGDPSGYKYSDSLPDGVKPDGDSTMGAKKKTKRKTKDDDYHLFDSLGAFANPDLSSDANPPNNSHPHPHPHHPPDTHHPPPDVHHPPPDMHHPPPDMHQPPPDMRQPPPDIPPAPPPDAPPAF